MIKYCQRGGRRFSFFQRQIGVLLFRDKIMPYKNKSKFLLEGERYHAYNRGTKRQTVFHDEQDYAMFLHLLKKYLDPSFREKKYDVRLKSYVFVPVKTPMYEKVELQAYCLMPNHFHLLVKLKTKYGMSELLNVVCSSYSTYYNERYDSEGCVWQGTYKAVRVTNSRQYLHLSRYIHLNPYPIFPIEKISDAVSSYKAYIGRQTVDWLTTREILDYFVLGANDGRTSYRDFVESFVLLRKDDLEVEELLLHGLKLE